MVAAYCVLDDDDNGVLDVDEFAVLLEDMASCSGIGIKVGATVSQQRSSAISLHDVHSSRSLLRARAPRRHDEGQ